MSVLTLADALEPGVRRWSSSLDADYVRGVVRRDGRRFAHLDGSRVRTVEDLHDALAEALPLPAYYGRNLDALAECLGDLEGALVLLWDAWEVFASTEPRTSRVVLALLEDSGCTALLRGAGAPRGG